MIRTLDESTLELSYLPFSGPEREVVFIDSQADDRVRVFVERNITKLNRIFADEGLKFAYVPDAAAENASACICSGEGERSGCSKYTTWCPYSATWDTPRLSSTRS